MNTFKKFTCSECGGTVEMSRGSGRTRNFYRGYKVPIPDDFFIPTCSRCGDIYVLPEIEGELNAILEKRFLEMQAMRYREMITILVERHGVKHHDIVRACGITPAYLSHVLNGKRAASTTLTRLLEAFVACGAEFVRHLKGQPWSSQSAGLYAVKMPKNQASAKERVWVEQAVSPQWNASEQGHVGPSCLVGQAA